MADFKWFLEFSAYLKDASANLDKMLDKTLKEVWKYLRDKIKSKYWVRQPWRPAWSSNTPLLKTWELRNSVMNRRLNKNTEIIYMNEVKSRLWAIHEYWQYIKMTDKMRKYLFAVVFKWQEKKEGSGKRPWYIYIPPRPIRRFILDQEEWNIANIIEKNFIIFK